MALSNIGAMGSGAAQQEQQAAAAIGQNITGAVGGVAARMGVDPQQLGAVVSGIMDAAANGDQAMLGEAIGAMMELASQAGQAAQGGGGGGAPAPASGPGGGGPQAAGGGGGQNPLDMLIELLSALGVPPQMIEQIVNAVAQSAQGGGGASPAVPGAMAA